MRLAFLLVDSNATAMRIVLDAQSNHSSTPTTPLSQPVRQDTNVPTASSRPTEKSLYKCPGLTSPKSKCPKHSGTMPSSTQPEWWIWSLVSILVSLLSPSCLSTAYAQIQELGSLSSLYATFIMRRTVMPHVPSRRPTPWMGLFSANLQLQMPFTFTIHTISITTILTVTGLTHTTSLCLSILRSKVWRWPLCLTPPRQQPCNQWAVPSWHTSIGRLPSLRMHLFRYRYGYSPWSSFITTIPHHMGWWHHTLCFGRRHAIPYPKTNSHTIRLFAPPCHFFSLAPKSRMSGMRSTTKASAVDPPMAATPSVTKHT